MISHTLIGCAGAIGGHFAAIDNPEILPSFARALAPETSRRSTELFDRVMGEVLGSRLTVPLP
jgi:hypothetical protein